ncbi:MAG: hypothetical protein LBI40_03565 [Treponema sp.]|nr:hypothetical protein [Treponema sp.]
MLKENISIPIDFLAIDYEKYNKLKDDIGYIYKTIEQEGQIWQMIIKHGFIGEKVINKLKPKMAYE